MTILVTGATGLVGTRLLPRLLGAGHDVRALVRAGQQAPEGVEAVEGDLLEPACLVEATEGITAVVHLAAVLRTPDPDLIRRANIEATHNLIEAVKNQSPQARVIMASTGLVYDHQLTHPAREDDPTNPAMPYPAAKVVAEKELRESGLTWNVLRFGFVYGDQDGHLESAPKLLGGWNWHPAQPMSLVHHRDIATAVNLALTGVFDGRTVNIVDDLPTTLHEIAQVVGAHYPESAEPVTDPYTGSLDGSLARSLGYEPTVRTVYQAAKDGLL
ncbi:NAD-dependent epimerase/dehydratase family protein [Kineosporia babensis]|uniref:NAD(P)-dependent oxidoreductase n=1 Tax=Kineosporia babensis TaxID=499548 RepID=A0A9X1SYL9_9ACTN|nr:NAD(P)-dependent oxidoreductase [Kineosporia babensis]MCD5311143.1 NAD(P)-dependent oxidoreductase [Kineosporia babensis]